MARINNSVTLLGRITRDIELKTFGETKVANFTVAIDRPKQKNGEVATDFIPCTAFGTTADFVSRYFGKGRKIAVQGEIQVDEYEKDGQKRTFTKVRVDTVDFADSKSTAAPAEKSTSVSAVEDAPKKTDAAKQQALEANKEDLPF